MERWINPILMTTGLAAGLLIGTGHIGEGIAVATLGIGGSWGLRAHKRTADEL
jgi:hypothetical protein